MGAQAAHNKGSRASTTAVAWLCACCAWSCGERAQPRVVPDVAVASDSVLFQDIGGLGDTGAATDSGAAGDTGTPTDTGIPPDTGMPPDTGAAADTQTDTAGPVKPGSDDGSCAGPCDDGLPCTADGCTKGSCTHALSPNFCLSGGSCVSPGPVPDNPCLSCDPSVATLSLQPVVGATCDDGVACTSGDKCDAQGNCTGAPAAGCCKSDLDCVSGGPCVAAVCNTTNGKCESQPKAGCCQQGVCCDPTTFAPRVAGTKCGTAPVKAEWACDGAAVRKREAFAGCDGTQPGGCTSDVLAWGAWTTTQTCPQGQACVLQDAATPPTCGTAPQCTNDGQCNDGKICTKDVCDKGACTHPPENTGVPCGGKAIDTEYQCASKGTIAVRYAVSSCDGVSGVCPETTKAPVWGPWKTWKTCGFNEVCKVADPKQPGVCTGAPKCQPGTTCCTGAGEYAAKATACGDKVVDAEAKCEGTKGGKLLVREAKAGCSGGSTSCYSYVSSYLAWGPWTVKQQCGPKETCEVDYTGSKGSCTKKTQCTANATCCDSDGFYAAKGSKCGTSPWKTEVQCSGSGKGAKIQERKGWRGCSGASTYCSSLAENLVWDAWTDVKTCPAAALCEVSFGTAKCVTACNPTQTCCSDQGEYSPKGTKCGSWSVKSEQKCSGSGKGAAIEQREAWYGCSGSGASCSYSSGDYAWGPWTVKTQCKAWQSCAVKFSSPSCVSTCDPTDACCDATGEYEKSGKQCSQSASTTETKCSGPGQGGKILERKGYRGCSGTSAYCSYLSEHYWWSPWTEKKACAAAEYCKGTYSHYCSSTPP